MTSTGPWSWRRPVRGESKAMGRQLPSAVPGRCCPDGAVAASDRHDLSGKGCRSNTCVPCRRHALLRVSEGLGQGAGTVPPCGVKRRRVRRIRARRQAAPPAFALAGAEPAVTAAGPSGARSRGTGNAWSRSSTPSSRGCAILDAYHPAPLHLFSSLDHDVTLALIPTTQPSPSSAGRVADGSVLPPWLLWPHRSGRAG